MKNCMFYLQLDPKSFVLGFSARLDDLYEGTSSIADNGN